MVERHHACSLTLIPHLLPSPTPMVGMKRKKCLFMIIYMCKFMLVQIQFKKSKIICAI